MIIGGSNRIGCVAAHYFYFSWGHMGRNPYLQKLSELGQSVWYDNLSRDVLNTGELKSLIEAGVTGLTSNPTIFKKAIADSSDYDGEMKTLLAKNSLSTDLLCEELMIQDVGAAADLLRHVFDATKGADGHASIEVSPELAHDTKGTVEAGKRLWSKLSRPNIMIKVPATDAGLPAIRELLEAGINVNVTLIFSVPVYEKVVEAYVSALEARSSRGEPVDGLASVASFFVSRVDSICESAADKLIKEGKWSDADKAALFGKVGIANSRLAYERFLTLFGGDRFGKLRAKGARVQRPLWASTGTKNPVFSPVMYVEELAGKNTVNTMPPQTLKALMEKATLSNKVESGFAEARSLIGGATEKGLPWDALLLELQSQGVKLCADSYRELLDSIEKKRKVLTHG